MNRTFTTERREKGFHSQSDLDAFFRYHDHTQACAECQKPGQSVPLDDGYQPTMNRCDEAQQLWVAWCIMHDQEKIK
jgi:hypothetical protein